MDSTHKNEDHSCSPACCRYMTASCLIDYDTLAVADKFGNVAIVSVIMSFVHTERV